MTQSLVVDYAAVDNDAKITPAGAKLAVAAGVRVVGIRRSVTYYDHDHRSWVLGIDPTAERDAQTWRDAGVVVFFYQFPAFNAGAPSPKDQVATFYAHADIRRGVDIVPEFDLEFPGRGVVDTGNSQGAVLALAEQHQALHEAQIGVSPGIYTSHVEAHDTNGLGIKPRQATTLGRSDLWQKIPYPVHAGSPLVDHFGAPHKDYENWDRGDLWRTPGPWAELDVGPTLVQGQGDAVGLPGFSHTVDVGYFVHMRQGERSGRVAKMQARLRLDAHDGITVGVFDATMTNCVKRAQAKEHLVDDGDIGPKSHATFCWYPVA